MEFNIKKDMSLDGIIGELMMRPMLPKDLSDRGLVIDDLETILENDAVFTAWGKRSTAVEQAQWSLSNPTSRKAKACRDALDPLFSELVAYWLRARLFGLSVPELSYSEVTEGFFVPNRLIMHKTTSFYVDNGGQVGLRLNGTGYKIADNPQLALKLFPAVNRRTLRYPAGIPMLAYLYWVWFLHGNVWEFWSRYLERYGSPSIFGTTKALNDPKTGTSSITVLRDNLMKLVNSGVGAFPEGTTISPIQTWNVGDGFRIADEKLNNRINTFFLGQNLTTEAGSVGSYGLGKVHQDVLHEIITGDIRFIEPHWQKVVNAFYAVNYPGTAPEKVVIARPLQLNSARAERDKVLWSTGLRFTEDYYRSNYGLEAGDTNGVVEPIHATGVMNNGDGTSAPETPKAQV